MPTYGGEMEIFMNITQLKYFDAVCTFQSVSEAAVYLHISQPSLSNAIKELENEFGVLLFFRHHKGMTLTAEGKVLYKLSRDILARMNHTETIMKDLGNERKKLRLGVPPMIGSLILPFIYRDFLGENTDIALEIIEGGRRELTQKLSDDYIDMVFLPHDKPLDKEFSSFKASNLEIVCCMAKNNPLSEFESVKPDMLKDIPLVLFENSYFQTEAIKKWFEKENIKPDIILQTSQLSTMLSVISENIAVGFMFRQLADSKAGLVSVQVDAPMFIDVSLMWKKNSYFYNSMGIFKNYVEKKNPFYCVNS